MVQIYGGRWETVAALGEGGQAYTYTVRDRTGEIPGLSVLKRLKKLSRVLRFKSEIEAVQQLSHPAIVKLIDAELNSQKPYLVMEYCQGGALSHVVPFWKGQPALELFEQILEGVAHAHSRGIIHRDLKPDNIFLRTPTGPPVVGDFGLAFLVESEERHTDTEEAVGPRLYMAPELEDGRADSVKPAADIYSLFPISELVVGPQPEQNIAASRWRAWLDQRGLSNVEVKRSIVPLRGL